ncbi:cell surface protein [Chaetoceros tenuissimus]|uniref:Cell surface protein n=1 Tax=Chaetoceros tenuissimus TaxID=426638 RepID=A0AAD3D3Y3_9STRA|nr:cell surface protein [Chaetoceros tenuissimus]
MRVQTEEWRRFIPGVRMYKGKKTLFYNGEKLMIPEGDNREDEFFIYDKEERDSWEVIIVLPGVEVIPEWALAQCENVKTVIMADSSVRRIEANAFWGCRSLVFVRLSTNLVYIGDGAFEHCESLPSMFIPPSCRQIGFGAFQACYKILILHVPQHTQIEAIAINITGLLDASPFELKYYKNNCHEVHEWSKNINFHEDRIMHQKLALHRACSSFHPLTDIVYGIVRE